MHCHYAGSPIASCRRDRHRGEQLPRPGKRAGNGSQTEEEMNPPVPNSDPATYVAAVLILYVDLPETPLRASVQDQWQARRLHDRGVSLRVVESALLLASLRRLVRPADGPPLSPIRSLAYFLPVIDELMSHPAPDNYLEYLRLKLRRLAGEKSASAKVQKRTFSDDR